MNIRIEQANGLAYRFNPETQPVIAGRMQAVVHARMLDEFTGLPMTSRLTVNSPSNDLKPMVTHGGIAGLVGMPGRLYPNLDGAPVNLEMTVSAQRFIPRRLAAALGPIAGFPEVFAPADFGDVPMHRAATVLRGRVVQIVGSSRLPLAAADVRVVGVWPGFPPADAEPDDIIEAPNLISLSAGLYAERQPAVDQLRRRVLGIALGQEKVLLQAASAGQRTLKISNRINLNVGDLLAIQPDHNELAEYIVVTGIDAAATADQPASVTLNYPLYYSHLQGTTVVPASLQAQAVDNPFSRAGIPGDRTVFCNTLTGLTDGSVAEIIGSGDPEYHNLSIYQVLTDADGYFRLPPIARVAQLRLEADRADLQEPHILEFYSPDYDVAEQRLDIVVQ